MDLKSENPQFRDGLYFAISNPIRLKFYTEVEDRDVKHAVIFQLPAPLDHRLRAITKLQKIEIFRKCDLCNIFIT